MLQTSGLNLLFKKAIAAPGSSGAPDLVRDATEILTGLIDSQRGTDHYPFHVLGSQGLAWARRGIRHEEDRAQYLRILIAAVQRGIRSYPESKELRQLEEDLRREILSLAIPHHLRQ